MDLLLLCRSVHALSGGAFDPAACARDTAGLSAVHMDDASSTVCFSEPVALDLGGIAKGFTLDRVEGALRAAGVDRALVHGGTSSVLALGAPPDRGAWPLEVRAGGGETLRLPLRDQHLSVSSPAGSSRDGDHRRGHIVDPRGGEAPSLARTVAVIGPSGAEAEAWSTALAVLGFRPPEMPAAYTSAIHTPAEGWLIAGADARQLEIRTTHLSESA
jgi:thiamine biosynthesis lipoprotein